MRSWIKAAAVLLTLAGMPAAAATLGGVDYATQYDYREFFAATDGKSFRVVLLGNALPGLPADEVAAKMLPLMQAAKPPPRLTFTYDTPAEPPRPDYRLVLAFDPALNLSADNVCKGASRFRPGTPGRVYVFAVYCRNDMALSQVTGWTGATAPDEPAMLQLYKDLFMVVFSSAPGLRPGMDKSLR